MVKIIWKPRKAKKYTWKIPLLLIILCCFSFYVTNEYTLGQKWALEINKLLSGRLWFQSYYVDNYEISLSGKIYDYEAYPLDNAFYRLLYAYGYLGFFVLALMYALSGLYISRKDDKK